MCFPQRNAQSSWDYLFSKKEKEKIFITHAGHQSWNELHNKQTLKNVNNLMLNSYAVTDCRKGESCKQNGK